MKCTSFLLVATCLISCSLGFNEDWCSNNEEFSLCKSPCPEDTCAKTEADTEPRYCMDVCSGPGCVCRANHRRADDGSCIHVRECPPFDCSARPNEVYDACPAVCPTDNCYDATPTGECTRYVSSVLMSQCNPKCRCVKGYWRNASEICVPYNQCPK